MRKAKIVDTIGPSTESPEGITKLVEAGMDVARLNRSHGTPEDHLKVYNNVRAASKATGRNVAAMVDLQGPKIRCGWFKKNAEGEDKVQLEEGQEFIITTDDVEGDEHITSTTFKGLPGDCHPGDPILIDDGKVRLEVTKVEGNNVHTKVVVAGPVSSHKGINLPGVAVSLPALTEKDEADLRWAIRTGADIIAMSFVRARWKRSRWPPSASSSWPVSTPSPSSSPPRSWAPWSTPRFRPVQRLPTAPTPCLTAPTPR